MQKTFYVHSTKHNDNHFNQTTNLNTLEKGIKNNKKTELTRVNQF